MHTYLCFIDTYFCFLGEYVSADVVMFGDVITKNMNQVNRLGLGKKCKNACGFTTLLTSCLDIIL